MPNQYWIISGLALSGACVVHTKHCPEQQPLASVRPWIVLLRQWHTSVSCDKGTFSSGSLSIISLRQKLSSPCDEETLKSRSSSSGMYPSARNTPQCDEAPSRNVYVLSIHIYRSEKNLYISWYNRFSSKRSGLVLYLCVDATLVGKPMIGGLKRRDIHRRQGCTL